MIKTILFIIVIAIIAYFIYRSFNEAKLKGGEPELSDDEIWEIVVKLIMDGENNKPEYIPSNYNIFPVDYKAYLIFEYAKGINAYHKKYNNFIQFDKVEDVSNLYGFKAYKYTNKNVELTILALENGIGNIESCYWLKVTCDYFMDTDSNSDKEFLRETQEFIEKTKDFYNQHSNRMNRLNSIENGMEENYNNAMSIGHEALNISNSNTSTDSNLGNRAVAAFDNNLGSLLSDSSESDNGNSTIKQPIIEPVIDINENMNSINNDDDKEDNQLAENNNNQNTHKDELGVEQETEKEAEAYNGNQEDEAANNADENNEIGKKLIEVFKQAVDRMNENKVGVYYLTLIVLQKTGEEYTELDEALKNETLVREAFNEFNTDDKYTIEYSKADGWKIIRNDGN